MPLDVVTPEIRRYLLGDLDAADAAALEARYVGDAWLLDEIRAAEDALIEAFLDGRLPPAERARFTSHYLASPVHRDRVATARTLRERVATRTAAPSGPWFYRWVAMAAAVVLASLWIVSRGGPPQQAIVPQTPRPQPQAAPPPAPPPLVPPPSPAPSPSPGRAVLALTLSPIATRGGEQPTHVRRPGPLDLVLRLEGAPGAFDRTYDVELQTVDGRVLWHGRSRAAAAGRGLLTTVRMPIDTVPADDYVVVVATPGGEERGRYVLRLRRR